MVGRVCRRQRRRGSQAWAAWLMALLTLPLFAQAQQAGPASVAFWYAAHPPLPELVQFDWVVLEPAHLDNKNLTFLVDQGVLPFAYLSVGELGQYEAEVEPSLLESAASEVRNEAWESQVMDLTQPAWRRYVLKRAEELHSQGYAGLFLDTLDSFMLLPEARHVQQRDALVSLLRDLNRRYPDLRLFFNRGFEVISDLQGIPVAVAVESIHAGWDPLGGEYRAVPPEDREWLAGKLKPLQASNIPIVAIEYLPPQRREEARQLASRLVDEGFIPFVSTPEFDYLGVGSVEVVPRRIALLYDPREGELWKSPGHVSLGGLLEYLGYRVDYLAVDGNLPRQRAAGLYAGVIIWMSSGSPQDSYDFNTWIEARLDEEVPLAFVAGLPIDNAALLRRLGLRLSSRQVAQGAQILEHDASLLGSFEAPLVPRTRGLLPVSMMDHGPSAALVITDGAGEQYTPVAVGKWGGIALAPYVYEEGVDSRRWILNPFAFLQRTLRLQPLPAPDTTTENGRRIATVHIDGDGFPSRAEMPGTPYAGRSVLEMFIQPHPLLTSVSVIEGEIGPRGMFPYLAAELEPIARRIFALDKVEVASHSFSHPFYWQPDKARLREDFQPQYGLNMAIPGYETLDFEREIIGARDYINSRLTTPEKPVKMIFWSGDALPDAATVRLAYDAGLLNVNGGATSITRADPSLTKIYPLLRPTDGGLHVYAPIINENLYTNLWQGPYYGFRNVIDTFELTDAPRRLRGLHLYYHFYSGTKQASIKVMDGIYQHMLDQQPISLWMSDYVRRVHGLYYSSLARTTDGAWQVRSLQGMRTLRLDPALGWPDLVASKGVAGVRELPQGRYIHLSGDQALLVLRPERDPAPALEQANIPLTQWRYLNERQVRFSFAGEFPLRFSVRSATPCRVELTAQRINGRAADGLWHFELPNRRVSDAQLICE
ncbi:hypothetical protein LCGC14_0310270 [marine sediment metagenome]